MNRIRLGLLAALAAVVALVGVTMLGATSTANAMPPTLFRITITNTTSPAMPISPGIILPHIDEGVLWVSGGSAGPGLELLAEVGNPSALIDALNGQLIGEIPPGGSASIELVIEHEVYLSTASMLVATNDSFVGLNSVILWNEDHSPIESQTIELNAYDAGTEANTELGSGFDGGQPDPSRGAENLDNGEATSDSIARSDQFSGPQATITIEVVYEDELEAGDDSAMDSGDDGTEEDASLETDEESMPAEDDAMGDGESMTDDSMPNTGSGGLVEGSEIGATLAALIALAALAAAASVYGVARVAVRRR